MKEKILTLIKEGSKLGRFDQWWLYKIPTILSIHLGTCFLLELNFEQVWTSVFIVLVALTIGGIYAYAVNDFSDKIEDYESNKPNFFQRKGSFFTFLVFSLLIGLGLLIVWYFRTHLELVILYITNWIVFALYSLKPFRVKERKFSGILFGGLGDSFFPSCFCLFVVASLTNQNISWTWVIGVAIWSLALGIKYMTWHQLQDVDRDLSTGTHTFVTTRPINKVVQLIHRYFFPMEIIGLICILFSLPSVWITIVFFIQLIFEMIRSIAFDRRIVRVYSKEDHTLYFQEFYELFLPLAILIEFSLIDSQFIILIIGFIALFYPRFLQIAKEFFWTFKLRGIILRRIKRKIRYILDTTF